MFRKHFVVVLALIAVTLVFATGSDAAQWGDLTGTFLYDGAVPTPTPINVTKDTEFCGKHKLVYENLVVNPKNKGVANIVVYLYLRRGAAQPEVHPSYAATATAEIRLDNEKCRFQPHMALVRTTQTLILGNLDAVGHNTKIDTFANAPINPIVPAGASLPQQFTVAERLPTKVSCNIHPWMSAWLVVKDNPYMAVTDEYGRLEIKNLPAGKWTFQAWQEKSGYVQQVKQDGKATKWPKGRFDVTIKPGKNDLGTILVNPANFNK